MSVYLHYQLKCQTICQIECHIKSQNKWWQNLCQTTWVRQVNMSLYNLIICVALLYWQNICICICICISISISISISVYLSIYIYIPSDRQRSPRENKWPGDICESQKKAEDIRQNAQRNVYRVRSSSSSAQNWCAEVKRRGTAVEKKLGLCNLLGGFKPSEKYESVGTIIPRTTKSFQTTNQYCTFVWRLTVLEWQSQDL